MKHHNNLIMGIDIGSAKVCVAICELSGQDELNLKGVGTSISSGVKRGKIIDYEDLSRSIDRAIQRAERQAGVRPFRVVANVPLAGIQFVHNSGFVLSKSDSGQITESEKVESIRRSKNVPKSSDQMVMHVIPMFFKVDGNVVQNPVGVVGSNLESQTIIILGDSSNIQYTTKALKQLSLTIDGLIYDALATHQLVVQSEERQNGVIVMDVGGRFTKFSVFKHGLMQRSVIIPIGGETITSDIATCLKVSIPEAERIKIVHSDVILSRIDSKKMVKITNQNNKRETIPVFYLSQIVQSRVQELLDLGQKRLSFYMEAHLPIVMTGAASSLTGFVEYVQQHFQVPVQSDLPESVSDIIDSPAHVTAVGLVLYAVKSGVIGYETQPSTGFFSTAFMKLKSFFS